MILQQMEPDNFQLDDFAFRRFTGKNLEKFYNLTLKDIISNGWNFRWVDNPDSIALFEFINPSCKEENYLDKFFLNFQIRL